MLTLRERERALADSVNEKRRIYLDLKYWIYCRDVQAGLTSDRDKQRLFDLLHKATQAGVAICPIEESVLTELLKQGDPVRRQQMAATIDTLSDGVCLKPFFPRIQSEILHFLCRVWLPASSLLRLDQLIWTRVAFALGAPAPFSDALSAEDNADLAARFDDHLWSMTTADVLAYMDEDGDMLENIRPDHDSLAQRINAENDAHATTASGFQQVYRHEVAGAFDAFRDSILEGMNYLHSRHPTAVPRPPDIGDREAAQVASIVAQVFLLKKLWRDFPTVHIQATLHARLRQDRQRRLKPNDFDDFRHASAALPFCDAFLTEGALARHLTIGTPSLAGQFDTTVVADPAEAVDAIGSLLALSSD